MTDELPPLHKVIAACKIGHKYFGPDKVDLAAAAWLERQQNEIERLREVRDAAQHVLNTFKKDEAQGYHSKDRQFAISILEKALLPDG